MSAAHELLELERAQLDAQWLYRQGDLVLGPLSGHQLVEKLDAGALTGESEVSATGPGGFRKLKDVEGFELFVARAAVKQRVEAEAQELRARRNRQRLLAASLALLVLAGLGFGGWQLARYAVVLYAPGVSGAEQLDIQMEPPVITPAKYSVPEERFEYPGEKRTAQRPPEASPDTPGKPGEPGGKTPDKPDKLASVGPRPDRRPSAERPGGKVSTDPDGMSTEVNYDQAAINRVVKQHQTSLHGCLKAEATRRPGVAARVPIEFTIGNDGRVAQLWIDHPQLKKGELFECMLGEMKKWPFKPYTGERATVNLAFTIGKK